MKSFKPKNNQTGFTLIELLFATVLLGIMLTIAISTFIGVFRFYIWAGTTRDNQASSRQLMDDISRNIASRKINTVVNVADSDSICLDQAAGSTDGPIKIFLENELVKIQKYTPAGSVGCADANKVPGDAQTISNTNMTVSDLKFTFVDGAFNNLSSNNKQSAVIYVTVTNGTATDLGGTCNPTDNFCDQADFKTAVSER